LIIDSVDIANISWSSLNKNNLFSLFIEGNLTVTRVLVLHVSSTLDLVDLLDDLGHLPGHGVCQLGVEAHNFIQEILLIITFKSGSNEVVTF
jgi:hypothetical protein